MNIKEIIKSALVKILSWQAHLALKRHPDSKVILIGGNLGKTGTKDAIFAFLSCVGEFSVRSSRKSFNSEIGLPLSILGLPNAWSSPLLWILNIFKAFKIIFSKDFPDILVLELGADKKGDIESATKWLRADILVLTHIPEDAPVHLENFKNKEELFEEKRHLLKTLKEDGFLIYDCDSNINKEFALSYKGKKVSFGICGNADCKLKAGRSICQDGVASAYEIELECAGAQESFVLQKTVGKQKAFAILPALAILKHMSLDCSNLQGVFEAHAPAGRMRLLRAKCGSALIDDSYNSSPKAALAALDLLAEFSCISGKKIVALADMLELGKLSANAHREVLQKAIDCADKVFLMGPIFKEISKEFESDKIKVFSKGKHEELAKDILNSLQKGDLILVKGSQSMRMEKLSKLLLDDSLDPKECLPRQEKEWLKR